MASREDNVYMAKLAEQAERYEEMVEFMEKVVAASDSGEELTVEERNLLSVAYKNVIGARRASWRIISSIEQKEESRGNDAHVATIREYRSKIENELSSICDGILKLLDSKLIGAASNGDSKVFYLKMKGDYYRYLAEFKIAAERKEAAENTLNAYKAAQDMTEKLLFLRFYHKGEFQKTKYSSETCIKIPTLVDAEMFSYTTLMEYVKDDVGYTEIGGFYVKKGECTCWKILSNDADLCGRVEGLKEGFF